MKGFSERFFAEFILSPLQDFFFSFEELRMTWPGSHIVKCTDVMLSSLA